MAETTDKGDPNPGAGADPLLVVEAMREEGIALGMVNAPEVLKEPFPFELDEDGLAGFGFGFVKNLPEVGLEGATGDEEGTRTLWSGD